MDKNETKPRDLMIKRLERIASILRKVRFLIIIIGAASLFLLLVSYLGSPSIESETWSIPSLLVFGWSLALYCLQELFIDVPEKLDKTEPWRSRFSNTMRRLGFRLLGVAVLSLTAALVILSYQLMRTWYMG